MTFKTLLLASTFIMSSAVFAEGDSGIQTLKKNVCDDLLESGTAKGQVQKCFDKFGQSDYFKDNEKQKEAKKKAKEAQGAQAKLKEEQKEKNIIFKTFTSEDLKEAGFGKPFFAERVNYKRGKIDKTVRLTEGDALCKYLGFEKAQKSDFEEHETNAENAHKKGLVIDTKFVFGANKEPELFSDTDFANYVVIKYHEIVCAKAANDSDVAKDLVKMIEEKIEKVAVSIASDKKKAKRESAAVDDSERSVERKMPGNTKKPDWATPVGQGATSK